MDLSGSDRLERARFVSILAHAARGHLNEIGLAAELSRRALDQGQTTRASSQLDRIEDRVSDVAALLADLQAALGSEVERAVEPAVSSLAELVETALAPVRREGEARGVAVTVRVAGDAPLELDVARTRRLTTRTAESLLSLGGGGSLHLHAGTVALGGRRATLSLDFIPAASTW